MTRSPVLARSPSASPSSFHTSFHYAPASPQHRSPQVPTAVSRRPSTTSPLGTAMTSPSHPLKHRSRPSPRESPHLEGTTKYVGIDAATQYSPMEPHNYFAPRKGTTQHSTSSNIPSIPGALTLQIPSQPEPTQTGTCTEATVPTLATTITDQQDTATTTTALPESDPPMLKAPHPLSPNKRRIAEGPEVLSGESTAVQAAGALPKRVKPDVPPPKVLPVRYELCAVEDIVVLIANMLAELIETNDSLAMRSGQLTRFHSRYAWHM